MHGQPANAARLAAERYIAEGWRIVPVPIGEKAPIEPGWPDTDWSSSKIDGNVGVILGSVSNHLCDVDLDAHWALALAPHFLPPTATFGRKSKPRSHWLYYCEGLRCQQFKFERDGKVELVELRGTNASNDRCGHQSIFPGSIHKSGETIEWDPDGADTITTVDRGQLIWATTRLAVACVIADGWLPGTQRNNKARAWAAGLLTMGWVPNEVYELFDAIFEVAGVERQQRDNDLSGVQRTIDAFERGDKLQGFGTLVAEGLVDVKVVRRVETLARTPAAIAAEAKLAASRAGSPLRDRFLREAHELDVLGRRQDLGVLVPDDAPSESESEPFFGSFLDIKEPAKPIDYVCRELSIAPGNKITILAGYGGASKGPFSNQLALCIASGKPFLGYAVKKRKVGFFDFETGRVLLSQRLWRMNNALGNDRDGLSSNVDFIISGRKITAEWLEMFEQSAEQGMVCFIDSYSSAVGGDKNKSEYADIAWELGRIAERKDLTIIVTMHARKNQKGQSQDIESVSGTGDLVSASQAIIRLWSDKKSKHIVNVECDRALEDPFPTFQIEWGDVPMPGAPMTTPGEKVAHGKWGLLAKRVDAQTQEKRDEKKQTATQAEIEVEIMKHMHQHYQDGIKADVRTLVQRAANPLRDAHRSAIRTLVKRGTLLANFHWKSELRTKQTVWLPGGTDSEPGVVQE